MRRMRGGKIVEKRENTDKRDRRDKKYMTIANLCIFLFSNFRKGRLPYIRPVGRLVGRSTSLLIFSINTGIKALY